MRIALRCHLVLKAERIGPNGVCALNLGIAGRTYWPPLTAQMFEGNFEDTCAMRMSIGGRGTVTNVRRHGE